MASFSPAVRPEPLSDLPSDDWEVVEEVLSCPITYEPLTDGVSLLPCQHRISEKVAKGLGLGLEPAAGGGELPRCVTCIRPVTHYQPNETIRDVARKILGDEGSARSEGRRSRSSSLSLCEAPLLTPAARYPAPSGSFHTTGPAVSPSGTHFLIFQNASWSGMDQWLKEIHIVQRVRGRVELRLLFELTPERRTRIIEFFHGAGVSNVYLSPKDELRQQDTHGWLTHPHLVHRAASLLLENNQFGAMRTLFSNAIHSGLITAEVDRAEEVPYPGFAAEFVGQWQPIHCGDASTVSLKSRNGGSLVQQICFLQNGSHFGCSIQLKELEEDEEEAVNRFFFAKRLPLVVHEGFLTVEEEPLLSQSALLTPLFNILFSHNQFSANDMTRIRFIVHHRTLAPKRGHAVCCQVS